MSLSSDITSILLKMLEDDGAAEIKRNDFAQSLGCVPSQINYVIASRFTPEHGYIVESRRGGGGYIKITRVKTDASAVIMHLVNSVGDSIDSLSCRTHISNLYSNNIITKQIAGLMLSATDDAALRALTQPERDRVRASILKQCLLVCGKDD